VVWFFWIIRLRVLVSMDLLLIHPGVGRYRKFT
jgi:hypothetical protein